MTVREIDHGASALEERMKNRLVIRVGVMGKEASESKFVRRSDNSVGKAVNTVIDVATIHEFGLGVPRRSFIADWADESEAVARKRLKNGLTRAIKKGTGLQKEADRFGLWAVGQIQRRIKNRIPPKLSKERIQQKGSDVPLIDTGQLRSSITYIVDLVLRG